MDFSDKVLGPYHIQWEIGRGGTAIVYRATDTRSGQAVALKILPPHIANDEMFLKRFIKEGKNAASLRYENIVPIYEAGEIDGIYYIAMELVTGGTLAEMISKRGQLFPMDESIHVLSQLAAALDFAHSQGFLHRDVKPSNVLMAEDGRVLLTDFGTAKQMFIENTIVTAPSQRIGTPSFMSPEQISDDGTVDYRADVYSLGVLAYKLFTGRLPFVGSSQAELLHKIIYELPISPDVLNPELPLNIVYNLKRVLAKDPSQRYESAGQFVAAMVAGQMWATKQAVPNPVAALRGASSTKRVKPVRRELRIMQAAVRPMVAGLIVLLFFLTPNTKLSELTRVSLSPEQIQAVAISQADYLSSRLMAYFDSATTRALWETYGAQLIKRNHRGSASGVNTQDHMQTIWRKLTSFTEPNSWLQRTWRDLNRLKVSDWLDSLF